MIIENRTVKVTIIAVLVLLVIPLLVMVGMMALGSGTMAQMGSTMGSGGMALALCILWSVLVAAALIFLIVLLGRGPGHRLTS